MGIAAASGLLAAVVATWAATAPMGGDTCLDVPVPADKLACIERSVRSRPVGDKELDALRRLAAEAPEAVARVAEAAARTAGSPVSRAALHDLAGQSLARLERYDAAASSFVAALALDSGATSLAWIANDGSRRWRTDLDPGDGRLERAARSLLLAGRAPEARETLARALALGATGWAADEGWRRTGGGSVPGLDAAPRDLRAEPTYPVFPDLAISLLDGGSFEPAAARGKVVLLDFWASWCGPCLQELPHLEKLWVDEGKNGLVVVAINSEETDEVARTAAARLSLTMPIGRYNPKLDEFLRVRTLPTVVLLDKRGRIRARWDGYGRGLERTVAAKVRDLLGADADGAPVTIARALAGGDRFELAWSREFPAPISGLAILPGATGGTGRSRIAAAAGKSLHLLDGSGETLVRQEIPPAAGRLVAVGPLEDGRTLLSGFRAGGTEVVLMDPQAGTNRVVASPAPVFDAAFWSAGGRPGGTASLAVATSDGVRLLPIEGGPSRRLEGAGEIRAVRVSRDLRLTALASDGSLRAYASDGGPAGTREAPEGGAVLVSPPKGHDGWGIGPGWVAAGTPGRFLPGDAGHVAVATVVGQLVILDASRGAEMFRAAWPGVTSLAAGDLDGDGWDELIVASGRRVSLVRRSAARPPSP